MYVRPYGTLPCKKIIMFMLSASVMFLKAPGSNALTMQAIIFQKYYTCHANKSCFVISMAIEKFTTLFHLLFKNWCFCKYIMKEESRVGHDVYQIHNHCAYSWKRSAVIHWHVWIITACGITYIHNQLSITIMFVLVWYYIIDHGELEGGQRSAQDRLQKEWYWSPNKM